MGSDQTCLREEFGSVIERGYGTEDLNVVTFQYTMGVGHEIPLGIIGVSASFPDFVHFLDVAIGDSLKKERKKKW